MRNHNEVTESVFRRRDEYNERKKQRRNTVIKISSSAACLGIATLVAFNVGQSNAKENPMIQNTPTSTTVLQDSNVGNIIKINNIQSELSADRQKVRLDEKDRVILTKDEGLSYYGTNIYPEVPSDLNEWSGQDSFDIYKRNGGTGETYYDIFVLNYSNAEFSRSINIEGGKSHYAKSRYGHLKNEDYDVSIINGEKIFIALNAESGYYFAEFVHKDVAFRMITEGLTESEIVSVISSLVK